MRDICNFISKQESLWDISFVHFVYEMELRKLNQPFFPPNYYLYLCAHGKGVLKANGSEYALAPGTLFLVSPWQLHEITADKDFTYLYISFNGPDCERVLESAGIDSACFVLSGCEHLIEFWMKSVRRIKSSNDIFLTCSVFMYTLSAIVEISDDEKYEDDNEFKEVLKYMDEHCSENINLKMVADIFFYNEKYFSHLFKERMGMNFTGYLNELRVRRALSLIDDDTYSIQELSSKCGFNDSYYFSKVFKKHVGVPPSGYVKQKKRSVGEDQ